VSAGQLLDVAVPGGRITEAGVRADVNVGLQYLDNWLRGNGAAAIANLMEDVATAEISRSQLWQWRHHGVQLDDGRRMDDALYATLRDEELARLGGRDAGRLGTAVELMDQLVLSHDFVEFLTFAAYPHLE
jgi:Malate synthase